MRGALWALGFLAFAGGTGMVILTIMAAANSDAPQSGWPDGFLFYVGIAVAGMCMIGAGFGFP